MSFLSLPLLAKSDAPSYERPQFDRFQGIVERMPFGKAPPPPPVAPTAPLPQALQEAVLARQLAMVAVNRMPGGEIAVGFIDNAQKPPRNYYLAVGEEADGYQIVSADYDKEMATIAKDGTSISLQLGKGIVPTTVPSALPPGVVTLSAPPGPMAILKPRFTGAAPVAVDTNAMAAALLPQDISALLPPGTGPADPERAKADPNFRPIPQSLTGIRKLLDSGIADESYMDKLRKRRDEILRQREAEVTEQRLKTQRDAKQLADDVYQQKVREINMGLIRAGQKPISAIELTPAEDAQLVRDGLLPAQ